MTASKRFILSLLCALSMICATLMCSCMLKPPVAYAAVPGPYFDEVVLDVFSDSDSTAGTGRFIVKLGDELEALDEPVHWLDSGSEDIALRISGSPDRDGVYNLNDYAGCLSFDDMSDTGDCASQVNVWYFGDSTGEYDVSVDLAYMLPMDGHFVGFAEQLASGQASMTFLFNVRGAWYETPEFRFTDYVDEVPSLPDSGFVEPEPDSPDAPDAPDDDPIEPEPADLSALQDRLDKFITLGVEQAQAQQYTNALLAVGCGLLVALIMVSGWR